MAGDEISQKSKGLSVMLLGTTVQQKFVVRRAAYLSGA